MGYAAIGFNVVAGNPMSIDYGEDNTSWGGQIFNVAYPDFPNYLGIYAPMGWNVYETDECTMTETTTLMEGMTSYTAYASHSMSASVGAFGASLGGSHTSAQY